MALPRQKRFQGRRAVLGVLRGGRRVPIPLGRAVVARDAHGGRVLFVIQKSVAKQSTARNRIKRVLDGWAAKASELPGTHFNVVVYIAPRFARARPEELRLAARESFQIIRRTTHRYG